MHFALLSPFGLTGKRFPSAVSNGNARFVARTPRSTRIYQHCTLPCCCCSTLHGVLINLKLSSRKLFHCLPACLFLFTIPSLPLLLFPSPAFFVASSAFYSLLTPSTLLLFRLHAPRLFLRCLSAPACWRHGGPRWAPNEFHFTDAARARNFICCQTEFAAIAPVAKVTPSPEPLSLLPFPLKFPRKKWKTHEINLPSFILLFCQFALFFPPFLSPSSSSFAASF